MSRFLYSTCPVCKSDKVHNKAGAIADHYAYFYAVRLCTGSGKPAVARSWADVVKARKSNATN